jgi:hypothetical protein
MLILISSCFFSLMLIIYAEFELLTPMSIPMTSLASPASGAVWRMKKRAAS